MRKIFRAAGVFVAIVVSAALLPAQARLPDQPRSTSDISGFWELSFDSRNISPANLAAGITKAVLDAQAKKDAHAIRWCNFLGMPFLMDPSRPLDIRQDTHLIAISPETNATPRYIYLDRSTHIKQDEFDPTTNGDSIAHWEGDTLVVDTVGFASDKGVTAIPGGGFRTENSHLVERYRLLRNGSVLSVTFRWEDPKMYRTPHTYEFRYYRLPADYEARPAISCDPFDVERAKFLETKLP